MSENKWVRPKSWFPGKRFKDHKRRRKAILIEHKGGKCAMCEGVFPDVVYDFHHTNPDEKEGRINEMSDAEVWIEMKKVILLCSNCHRTLHDTPGTPPGRAGGKNRRGV